MNFTTSQTLKNKHHQFCFCQLVVFNAITWKLNIDNVVSVPFPNSVGSNVFLHLITVLSMTICVKKCRLVLSVGPCHVHVAAAGYRKCACLWVMWWNEQLGLKAKRRSSMSRSAISPSFSLFSLLPLSSLQDEPWLSPPPRLSSRPSSRVAVLNFFQQPLPIHTNSSHSTLDFSSLAIYAWLLVHGKDSLITIHVKKRSSAIMLRLSLKVFC